MNQRRSPVRDTPTAQPSAPDHGEHSHQPDAAAVAPAGLRRRRLGRVIAATLATGLMTGVLLVLAPFIPAGEARATGALPVRPRARLGTL